MPVLYVNNVVKKYVMGKIIVEALRGINVSLEEGEMISIMGPSGSGKTTLLNIISGIDHANSGDVVIHDTNIASYSDAKLSEFRNKNMGFIFQAFNLVPVLNAYENIEYPLILQKMQRSDRKKRVNAILESVAMQQYAKHRPDELSGGQRQRIAIARALVTKPSIVIADEPTASLDHKTGTSIMELMKEMNRVQNTTFVFSTHDSLVSQYATRIVRIFDGLIESEVQK